MRGVRAVCAVLAMSMLAASARAGDPPKLPETPTFETAPARPDELPAGIRIVPGTKCVSRAATEFLLDPGFAGSLDRPPIRKSCQSFEGPAGVSGSVLLFEYDGAVPSFLRRVLAQSLWGEGGRSAQRPDEVIVQGRMLWIVSFPYGDPTAEWAKGRLRARFGVRAERTRPELAELQAQLWRFSDKRDPKAGLAALDAAGAAAADWSLGAYLRGEFLMATKDWAASEAAYRRALELDATLADPLAENLAWAASDGVGNALFLQKKFDEATKVLARSKAQGRALRLTRDETPHTAYMLAGALAQLGKWDDSLRELTDAVAADRRWLKLALTEEAFATARARPEFRVVLELDPPRPAPVPPKPVGPAKPAEAITFDALLVKATELPAGWSLSDGSQCVSTAAHTYFVTPDIARIASGFNLPKELAEELGRTPKPVRKACQSIVRPDGAAGSALLFEFAADVDPGLVTFLQSYIWGQAGPTARNPEEVLTHGHFLWIFSFPRGDVSSEWTKQRLRTRFRVPAHRTRPEIAPLTGRILAAQGANDAPLGLRLLDARAALLADVAFAWFQRGEFCQASSDPAGAEAGYRRALALHDALVDPLDENLVWACLDGLGSALLQRKKPEDARAILVKAKALAAERAIAESSASTYNLACALALLKKYDEALVELKAAIAAKPSWKEQARDDADLAEARKRPDFQALLAP